jgi:hypothetical protein
MKKFVILGGIIAGIYTGCVADSGWKVAYEQERAARLAAQQAQPASQPPPPQRQPQQPIPQQQGLTRSESMEYCKQLDQDREISFKCSIIALDDGTQIMSFVFPDEQYMLRYWRSITEKLAAHYCATSNNLNIQAALGQILLKEDAIRMFSCRMQKWGEWAKADLQKNRNKQNQHF